MQGSDDRSRPGRDLQAAIFAASFYALARCPDETRRWLRFAIQQGFRNYPWAAEHDPWLSAYRGDPEFTEIFETLRKAWSEGRGDGRPS